MSFPKRREPKPRGGTLESFDMSFSNGEKWRISVILDNRRAKILSNYFSQLNTLSQDYKQANAKNLNLICDYAKKHWGIVERDQVFTKIAAELQQGNKEVDEGTMRLWAEVENKKDALTQKQAKLFARLKAWGATMKRAEVGISNESVVHESELTIEKNN